MDGVARDNRLGPGDRGRPRMRYCRAAIKGLSVGWLFATFGWRWLPPGLQWQSKR
jgi:hypothetical protein